MFQDMVH